MKNREAGKRMIGFKMEENVTGLDKLLKYTRLCDDQNLPIIKRIRLTKRTTALVSPFMGTGPSVNRNHITDIINLTKGIRTNLSLSCT